MHLRHILQLNSRNYSYNSKIYYIVLVELIHDLSHTCCVIPVDGSPACRVGTETVGLQLLS